MKVLITGGNGFLGHHVVARFKGEGYKVCAPTRQEMNLMSPREIRDTLWNFKPDHIVHLAAQCGGIGINREKPGEFLYNNMMMTTNLIHAWKNIVVEDKMHIDKFVGIGTVCSYPKHTPVPFKESDLYNGYPEETNAPYGLAKRMQLEMLRAYRTQYGLNGIFLIPVNMTGEYDNFDDDSSHVIPAMLKKFHNAKNNGDKTVTLWGNGSASREFLYAGDCADAIYWATVRYSEPDPVNIGTGQEITICDLAYKIKEVVGFTGEIVWDITKPNGQPRRCLDVRKAKQEFGFRAQTSLDIAIRKTYLWAQSAKVL
jgi:GDP-L-fucose synthase